MKILVVYESRHGFTEHCLGLLSSELPPAIDLWPLRQRPGFPDLTQYDAVVFGGPVYFGRWAPHVRRWTQRHRQALLQVQRLGAFVVSLSPRAGALEYLRKGLDAELQPRLGHLSCFGGSIRWKQLAWWEKWILRRARGLETDASNLDLTEIQGMATWLSANSAAR